MSVRASVDVELEPRQAFEVVLDELALALARVGLTFEPGADGGVRHGEAEVGRVVAWEPSACVLLEWRPADWEAGEATEVELRFERLVGGTRVTLEHRGLARLVGGPGELAGWFAGQVAAPLLAAVAPGGLGDWLTDRRARRPSGALARETYADPLHHRPNFAVLLDELALTADDVLLEVGCGGGVFLADALRSGCRAAGVDHSAEMVRLAREVDARAVADRRLDVRQADAASLPFDDETFTAAAMTGVLGFLPDAVAALAESGGCSFRAAVSSCSAPTLPGAGRWPRPSRWRPGCASTRTPSSSSSRATPASPTRGSSAATSRPRRARPACRTTSSPCSSAPTRPSCSLAGRAEERAREALRRLEQPRVGEQVADLLARHLGRGARARTGSRRSAA